MLNQDIRVVHIIKVKGVSGAENHLLTLLPALQNDLQITLILLVEPGKPMTEFAEEFKKQGIDVIRIEINHHLDPSILWKIYYLMKKIRPHIVHTHLLHADLYGIPPAVLRGTKILVSTKHGYDEYERTSLFYRLNHIYSRWLSRVITISNALQDKVASAEGISKSKMVTIYYGLDGDKYASNRHADLARSLSGLDERVCIIGTVGRLVPVKGYDILLNALADIELEFRVLIAGDGPLKKDLEKMSHDLGLASKVKFLGFRKDISRILSGLDVFVLPTLGEGFGLVLLEAMAHHIPVISTDTMAVPEIVDHEKTGLLVPPKDVTALRQAIESMIRSPDRRVRMGEAGWEKLLQSFTVEKMTSQTLNLYRELMDSL